MGLSTTSYTHSDDFPIYGTGQGSGNSPMIWCFISSILFHCYESKAAPAQYCNPDGTNKQKWFMIGFVDDTNGQANQFLQSETKHTLQKVYNAAQTNATLWAQMLGVSGGSLELQKCSYHVINWKFSIQGAPVLAACASTFQALEVRDPLTNRDHSLSYIPPHKAHKTLGHYKEPAGTQVEQFRKLKDKSDSITTFLWSTPVTRSETALFYHACYIPAVCYPLTCSHFTFLQLSQIQQRAMSIILARSGFNRNTKKEILYGPIELGGAGFHHLYQKQSHQQVMYFLRHWRLKSEVGRMLRCAMAWAQVNVGVSYPILEHSFPSLPHFESKWIASIRQYLASICAGIQVEEPGVPHLQRQGDSFIMDHVLESGLFTKAEIRRLNYCRLYLQAITIADIASPDGENLVRCKLQGNFSLQSSRTRWLEVHQDKPSSTEWQLWRKANLLWSYPAGRLRIPLREWLYPSQHLRHHYMAYISKHRLWIRSAQTCYQEYKLHRHTKETSTNPKRGNTGRSALYKTKFMANHRHHLALQTSFVSPIIRCCNF
jgi:hypothetical protein